MPIGNLTSQFFANVYLNELDYFVKHTLKAKYYIRYVDDFVILHESKEQLEKWKESINQFIIHTLQLSLHPQKSRVISLSKGVDFVGFRNFWKHALIRKRNIRTMQKKIELYKKGEVSWTTIYESFKGWQAYAMWANAHKVVQELKLQIIDILWDKV